MPQIGAPISDKPPRLLGGAALLFWGAMAEQPVIGLTAALLVEAVHWLPTRFDFSQKSYLRAWQTGALLFIFTVILQIGLGRRIMEIYQVIIWAPIFFLPVELAQRYGTLDRIPANTFSFFARRKMLNDLKEGRIVDPLRINTGYPFIILCILTAAQANNKSITHFIGLLILTVACLWAPVKNRKRWIACGILITAITLSGFVTQVALKKTVDWLEQNFVQDAAQSGTSGDRTETRIGSLGEIKQSPQIFWRAQFNGGKVQPLLREATYNHFTRGHWSHTTPVNEDGSKRETNEDYVETTTLGEDTLRIFNYQDGDAPLDLSEFNSVTLRGQVQDGRGRSTVLPAPPATVAIDGLGLTIEQLRRLRGTDDGASVEVNSLGTVRLENPRAAAVEFSFIHGGDKQLDQPPFKRYHPTIVREKVVELAVPEAVREALNQVIDEAGLRSLPPEIVIPYLGAYFKDNFTYTTHLRGSDRYSSLLALRNFLLSSRRGHCEYFATATTLILRELGIPARYCVGFAVKEKDPNNSETWLLRGTAAHAWSRAYINGRWQDVDLTPPDWFGKDAQRHPQRHPFFDWFQRTKEDFVIWRSREENQRAVVTAFSIIGVLLLAWFSYRLYQRRSRQEKETSKGRPVDPGLGTLLPTFEKILGPHPTGAPLEPWLNQLIGVAPDLDQLLSPALNLHQKLRFAPIALAVEERAKLHTLTKELNSYLKRNRKSLTLALSSKDLVVPEAVPNRSLVT